jgi:hypothetical protein
MPRLEDTRNGDKVLTGKPPARRPVGRSGDKLKIDIRDVGYV